VGVKFRSDVDGYITGLRFYKGNLNTGTHTGHLWAADGTLLAEAVFTGESASGWQEVTLASPVAIQANTTYVASYYSPGGYYAITPDYFLSAVDNLPLRALANGADGPNGVYHSGSSGFPTETWTGRAPNYWVDVVFTTQVGADTTPPTVVSVIPANGATGVSANANIQAVFSEALDPSSVTAATVELRDASNTLIPASVTYNNVARTVTLDPASSLEYLSTYTATIRGGVDGVKDLAGNVLAADYVWSFTTAAPPPPPPDEGPGGPILVVASSANPFGRYYAEILRAEGLNAFTVTDISNVTAGMLANYDVVILAEMSLTSAQATLFGDWVTAGGNLIAMRPDAQLASLLGITPAGGTLSDAYLLVDTANAPGAGIVNQTIQFHGAADRYTLNGATAIATLYSDATTPTTNPAVTWRSVGTNGGQAAMFAYDLARSVVYTRQGNPAWAGDERDGRPPMRSDDLFYGAKSGDVQPDWVNLSKVAIPQADEQQRLLANMILTMNADRKPLPRFWYFPRDEKAAVVMTGDDHFGSGTAGRFDSYIAQSAPGCSVTDWECIRSTSYIYDNSQLTDAQVASYSALGFEIASHINTNCADYTPETLDEFYTTQLNALQAKYPSLPAPQTVRNHCVTWSDWVSQPEVELAHGIRLDTNYYFWPPEWIQNRPGMFTGSGMPMRFARTDGTMVDVYQATTQMTDESSQEYPYTINTLLDNALGPQGYYGFFVANMHNDSASSPGSDAIIAAAQARGVPVISARQLLEWVDGRNASSFGNLSWDGATLTFDIAVGAGANGLRAMLPLQSGVGPLTGLTRNGSPHPYTTETIKGVQYAVFAADAGSYAAGYAMDTTPPVISNVTATPQAGGTAIITWTTDEAANSLVQYGLSPDALTLSVSDPAMVTAHQVTLTGLDLNTTYYYRVTSVDVESNSATWPAIGDPPASFTTPGATFSDTTAADFSAGTVGTCIISQIGDGEVMLSPLLSEEFSGTGLPTGWSVTPWNANSSYSVSGGVISINDSLLAYGTLPASYGPGRSLEFVATFNAYNSQHIGFGTDLNAAPWAIFSTGSPGGTVLRARTMGASSNETLLSSVTLGVPHRFRIEWTTTAVNYYVDGNLLASHTTGVPTSNMRPVASDITNPGPDAQLTIDWMRMSPYASPCTFESRIFDAGQQVSWSDITWDEVLPSGTNLAVSVRSGNTPMPDGTWSAFTLVTNGGVIGASARYIQYRAVLSTTDSVRTPILERVALNYTMGPDTTPPQIVNRSPSPGASGVLIGSNVTVQFNEPMDAASITGSTFYLRAAGDTNNVPATVTYDSLTRTATLDPTSDLERNTLYTATVSSAVTDASGNPLGAEDAWSFTTEVASHTDTTAADFGAGTGSCRVDSAIGNGALRLPLTLDEPFSGNDLPAGWSSGSWTGGSPVVAGGLLTVNGAIAGTGSTYSPGRALEFVATFTTDIFQHIGFVESLAFNGPYAIFSTFNDPANLYARTSAGGNTLIPGSYIGTPHRYRIEWSSTDVKFYVDGSLVATHNVTITQPMIVAASDYHLNGNSLAVDWMALTPYLSPCVFESAIIDVPPLANWMELAWNGNTPTGTTVSVATRSGDTPTPDGSWSGWQPLSGTTIASPDSRYFQYQLTLTSDTGAQTPIVESVTVTYDAMSNTAPTAADDAYATDEDTTLSVATPGVLGNDSDPEGNPLTAALVAAPAHGTLTLNPDGSFEYTPAANYNGADSFTYKANDGSLDSNTAIVTITVNPVNDAPVAQDLTTTTDEDTPVGVTLTATDVDGDPLTYTVVSGPTHGALSGTAPNLTYTPDANYNGADSFTYKANDGALDSNTATVTITVGAVNDAPVAQDLSATTDEDTAVGVTLTATDVDGDPLTYTVVSGPAHGVLSGTVPNLTYTPDANYNGADSFTYKANDGSLDSNTATVTITVGAVNDAPVAQDLSATTDEDTAVGVTLTATDVDGDPLTYTVVSGPAHGVLSGTAPNLTYTPDANYTGADSFTYQANDGSLDSNTATVTITVNPVNDAPVAQDLSATTDEDTPLGITLTATDIDGDPLTYTVVSDPTHGALSGTAPNLTYTPDANYNGADSFTYQANDGSLDSNTATVTITVNPVNDAPVAQDLSATTDEDTPLGITLTATDIDGDPLTYTVVSGPTHGALSGTAPNLTYTPDANYNGADSFTYQANDGALDSNTAKVTITVGAVNDAPVAQDLSATTDEDTPLGITLTATDVDGDPLTYTVVSGPTHGVLSGTAPNLTYTPDANWNGTDSFTYKANDGALDSNTATVTITVGAVNDAPVAQDLTATTDEDTPVGITLTATDVDGDPLTYTVVSGPAHGVLSGTAPNPTYTPAANYTGADSFTYQANDGVLDSNTATVTITVGAVNDAPVAQDLTATTDEDTPVGVTLTATDVDGDPLTYTVVSGPTHGALSGTAPNLTYTPDANYNGADSFTYKANDGALDSNTATVTIIVGAVNDAPVAQDLTATTDEDTAVGVALTATDVDGDSLTYTVVSGPAHGVLSGTAPNLTYTPAANYNGADSFTYKANDGSLDSNTATVTITVGAVNDAPTAADDAYATDEDATLTVAAPGVLGNDSDPEGDALTAVLVTAPAHGTLTLNADGSFEYTPAANYNGADSFTYKANDGALDSNTATVTITVGAVNDAPVAQDLSATTDEDTPLGITLTATDIDGDPLTYTVVSGPTHGALSGTAPNLTYTPDANWNGTDSFTYQASDGALDSNIATVTITVNPVNDAPVAQDLSATTDEDTALGVTLTATDVDGDPLTYTVVSGPAHGALSGTAPNLTYTPAANYNGADSFTYQANDGSLDSNTATVTITVGAVNDAPTAAGDAYATDEDATLSVAAPGVLGNDSDPEGNPLTAALVDAPAHGTLTLNADGSFEYTPAANYNGADSFTYQANDGSLDSNTATVTITVGAVNDAPVAQDLTATTDEDTAVGITLTATDVDGDPLTYTVLTGPAHGTLSGTAPNLTYTPATNYTGADSFTYQANDGALDSNTATVTITVNPVNDAPVAQDLSATTDEDTAVGITLTATDVDGDPLTYTVVSGPAHGVLSGTAPNLTYTPAANYNGADSFTYKANDGSLDSNTATVTITVNPVNDAPVAQDLTATTDEDTPVGVALTATDVDGDSLTYTVVSGPAHGVLSGTAPNLTYTPAANYNGADSFTYKANDGSLDSNTATVTITVGAVNDAPTAADDAYATDEDATLTVAAPGVLGNDSDPEGDALTAVLVTAPAHGTLTLNADGSFEYTPAANYNGADSFTYQASDGALDSNTATVTITVNPVNDAPVAQDLSATTDEDTAVGVTLTATDIDGDPLTYTVVSGPTHGVLSGTAPNLTYTPDANWNGTDSFTYKANDGSLDSNTATVTITVNPVNDAPVAQDLSATTDEDTAVGIALTATDIDGDPLTYTVVIGPAHGVLSGTAPNLTYTPDANYNGVDSFTYKANDGALDSNTATVTITVGAVNDAPTAADDAYATDEDVTLTVAAPGVLGNDSDPEGNPLTAALVAAPVHGTLTLNADGSFEYTPAANYNGADSFTYKANDGSLDSNIATVTITVGAVNDAPAAQDLTATTDEDTAVGITLTATDVDGDPLTYTVVSGPTHGVLSGTAPNLTYTPDANWNGTDSFTYKANDGSLDSNIATVTITVNPVNDAPVAQDLSATTDEDTALGVTLTATDVDGDSLTYTVVSGPAHGALSGTAPNLTYTPDANWNGTDSFTYKANDGALDSNTATVTITVNPVNDAPVAQDLTASTDEDTPLGITLTATDVDGDPLTYTVVSGPTHGVLSGTAPNLTYTPDANWNGTDSFTYQANDGALDSNTATVTITVGAVNDAPVAQDLTATTDEDTAVGTTLTATDVDGDPLTYTVVSGPAHGTLSGTAPNLTYTPATNYTGADSFTYKANDGALDSNTATVTITVGAVNDAPTAAGDAYATDEDTVLTVAAPGVLGNDSDPEGNPLTAALVAAPAHGTLTLNADGSFEYTPAANYTGADSFTYKASDGALDSNTATVAITVNPVNDAPVAQDQAVTTEGDTPIGITLAATDVENDALTFSVVAGPTHGTLSGVAPNLTYTPQVNYSGLDSFTFKANDGAADSNIATVTIQVRGDLIFKDGFESGDLSAWSTSVTDGGDLSATSSNALVGSYGLQAVIDDNTAIYVQDNTPEAEARYRARFYFHPNSIVMAPGENHYIFYAQNNTMGIIMMQFYYDGSNYLLRGAVRTDTSGWLYTAYATLTNARHYIEIDWQAATAPGANNGSLTVWIDGVQSGVRTGVDNDTLRVETVQLGAVMSIDNGTRGTYYFDAFESRRASYIGIGHVEADFSADVTIGDAPLTVNFTNLTQPADLVTSYLWDFGDGNTSTEVNPVHTYAAGGSYTVSLTAFWQGVQTTRTKVNYIVVSDLIFKDGFESGGLSAWSTSVTDGGDLSASAAAALVGNYGLQAVIDDNAGIYVQDDSPAGEPRYRARFYFDPNSIVMTPGDNHYIFYAQSNTMGIIMLQFYYDGSNYLLRGAASTDAGSWLYTTYTALSDARHFVEIDWQAATAPGANNGSLTLWIDGVQSGVRTGVDNDTLRIERVQLGAVMSIDNGTRGTYYFDAFESRRASYIGMGHVEPNFTANRTRGLAPLTVNFTNLTQPADLVTSYLWDFGDGNTSTEANPVHTYSADGSYTVSLTAYWEGTQTTHTKTNYIVISDLIFKDGFESGDLSAWSTSVTDGGDLSVTNSNALVGSYGLQAVIDDNNGIYVQDNTPEAEARYRARFYFDPNSIVMAPGENHYIFYAQSNTIGVIMLQFYYDGSRYLLRGAASTDAAVWRYTAYATLTDARHFIEIDWQAATAPGANNGSLTLWIDGVQSGVRTGVDNDTLRIERVQLGAVMSIDNGTRGTYYFDAFESRRASYIGMGHVEPNFTANRTRGLAPLTVNFTNLTQPAGMVTSYLWDFGDGNTSTEANPVHTYSADGRYTVSLTAYWEGTQTTHTKTDYIVISDLIFKDGFESGGLSAWSTSVTDGGDLSVTSSNALVGSYSLQAVIDDNTAIYVQDNTPEAEARYRARFYFDPNSIVMAPNDNHYIFYAQNNTMGIIMMQFYFNGSNYLLRTAVRNDAGTWLYTTYSTLTDAGHYIEIDWQAATAPGANNGSLTVWIDGVQVGVRSGVDNDTLRVETVQLGAVMGIDNGTRGTYYFDAFESRRASYIGPDPAAP
jgi:VCBS repeat-containing protein